MPGDGLQWADGKSLLGGELTASILNGTVPASRLDDMVLRIVASWYQLGQDSSDSLPPQKKPLFSSWFRDTVGPMYYGSPDRDVLTLQNFYTDPRGVLSNDGNVTSSEAKGENHRRLARQIAAEGIVVLKNVNGTLPLSRSETRNGPYKEIGIFGTDAAHSSLGPNGCLDRGCNMGTLGQGWGSGSVEYAYLISPLEAIQARATQDRTAVNFVLQDDTTAQVNATAGYIGKRGKDSICLVFVTSDSGEGYLTAEGHQGDRSNLNLWHGGDSLILAVAQRCPNTVVVVHSVGPVLMEVGTVYA